MLGTILVGTPTKVSSSAFAMMGLRPLGAGQPVGFSYMCFLLDALEFCVRWRCSWRFFLGVLVQRIAEGFLPWDDFKRYWRMGELLRVPASAQVVVLCHGVIGSKLSYAEIWHCSGSGAHWPARICIERFFFACCFCYLIPLDRQEMLTSPTGPSYGIPFRSVLGVGLGKNRLKPQWPVLFSAEMAPLAFSSPLSRLKDGLLCVVWNLQQPPGSDKTEKGCFWGRLPFLGKKLSKPSRCQEKSLYAFHVLLEEPWPSSEVTHLKDEAVNSGASWRYLRQFDVLKPPASHYRRHLRFDHCDLQLGGWGVLKPWMMRDQRISLTTFD